MQHRGVSDGKHFFYGKFHGGFGEDDEIVPEAEGFLHFFEAAHDGAGQGVAFDFGHFQGVTQEFADDADGVGIGCVGFRGFRTIRRHGEEMRRFKAPKAKALGLQGDDRIGGGGEFVDLVVQRGGEQGIDGFSGIADFFADAPPGAEFAEGLGGCGFLGGALGGAIAAIFQVRFEPGDGGRVFREFGEFGEVAEHDIEIAQGAELLAEFAEGFGDGFLGGAGHHGAEEIEGGAEAAGGDAGLVDGIDVAFVEGFGDEGAEALGELVGVVGEGEWIGVRRRHGWHGNRIWVVRREGAEK
jgi:hypothetical protein